MIEIEIAIAEMIQMAEEAVFPDAASIREDLSRRRSVSFVRRAL